MNFSFTIANPPLAWSHPNHGSGLNRSSRPRWSRRPRRKSVLVTSWQGTSFKCSGCDSVIFRVDDGTFALVHLTWAQHPEPDPWPETQRLGGFIALE